MLNIKNKGNLEKVDMDANITVDVLCKGVGHISICGACFHTDDRFGTSWRCKRACATIDGIWGPTVCCKECNPKVVCATDEVATGIKFEESNSIDNDVKESNGIEGGPEKNIFNDMAGSVTGDKASVETSLKRVWTSANAGKKRTAR